MVLASPKPCGQGLRPRHPRKTARLGWRNLGFPRLAYWIGWGIGWGCLAIYHASVKSISRGKGHSATAAAAYRAGIRIEDATTGLIHDYTRRGGVLSVDMLAPKDAPAWAADPSQLWNAAETVETRKNARVGRELVVGLPYELTANARRELARDIGQMLVDRYGVAVQVAVHAPDKHGDDRNHHAHILMTSREMTPQGLGGYAAKMLDDFKAGAEEIKAVREDVGLRINLALMQAGSGSRVDHRSLDDQAQAAAEAGNLAQARELDRLPTIKEGRAAGQREARQAINGRIRESNRARQTKWDRWEAKAASEGRLMAPSYDTKPENRSTNERTSPRNEHPTTRGARGNRAPRFRSRPDGRPIANGSLDTVRVRSSRDGPEPLLAMPRGHGFATVEPRRGAEQRGDPLRRNEPRYSSDRDPLHLASGITAPSAIRPKAKASTPQKTSAPPQAGRPLTGRSARDAVASAGGTVAQSSGGDKYARARMAMDERNRREYDRVVRLIIKIMGQSEAAAEKLWRQDADFRRDMEQSNNLLAINWRAEDQRAQDAAQRLAALEGEEARRVAARERAERAMKLAQIDHDRWHDTHPPPPKRLWSSKARDAWEQTAAALNALLEAARDVYRRAFQLADIPASIALEKERERLQAKERQAVHARQRLALLPSEKFAQTYDAENRFPPLPAEPEASAPDFVSNSYETAAPPTHQSRWKREIAPRPPR